VTIKRIRNRISKICGRTVLICIALCVVASGVAYIAPPADEGNGTTCL